MRSLALAPIRLLLLSVATLLATNVLAADPKPMLVVDVDPLPAAEQAKRFHLPPGFEIQLVASEPAVRKPINLAFDGEGKLYVSQSVEYPFPVAEGTPGRDILGVLVDKNDDGVPETPVTFADGLNIPIGVAPVADGVLSFSIPTINKLIDKDDDGKVDERKTLYSKFGYRDTHGMASSFNYWIDGWVYACHGFSNTSTVVGADGKAITMSSGNTFRMKPDGSRIEQFTHGQVNPFGMAINAYGDIFTADCHSNPITVLLRGAYYVGRPHDGLGYCPPIIEHAHGSTGICGIAYYAADHFPKEYQDNVFIGNPVTGRVNRDRLDLIGSTYKAIEQPDFITCDDPWFRPVDIRLAPDGSLYIADFYNRIIGHYEVPLDHPQRDRERGRIWRVTYKGTPEAPAAAVRRMPNLKSADRDQLISVLADPNLVVRTFATHELVDRIGKPATEQLQAIVSSSSASPEQRVHALWALARLDQADVFSLVDLFNSPSSLVRVHALKILATLPNPWMTMRATSLGPNPAANRTVVSYQKVLDALAGPDPMVARAATETLATAPTKESIHALLTRWKQTPASDAHLIHVLRMALRDGLATVLDTFVIEGTKIEVNNLTLLVDQFDTEDSRWIASICLGIPKPSSAQFIFKVFKTMKPEERPDFDQVRHVARFLPTDELPALERWIEGFKSRDVGQQRAALEAIAGGMRERGAKVSPSVQTWANELAAKLLSEADAKATRSGLEIARDFKLNDSVPVVERLAAVKNSERDLRFLAFEAVASIDPARAVPILGAVLANDGEKQEFRIKAADLLGERCAKAGKGELVRCLSLVSLNLATAIARQLSLTKEGGEQLLVAIEQGKTSPIVLRNPWVRTRLVGAGIDKVNERLDKLLADVPAEDEILKQLFDKRRGGFMKAKSQADRGAAVFEKTCAKCHQTAGKGAKVGPQLDGVGIRGLERLLEDILAPNRNVDQMYRASLIAMADGRVVNGLVLREEGNVLVVADAEGKEVPLPMSDIEERKVAALSPMPANVAETIPEGDFYDLIAFLLAQRQPPAK